MSQNSAAIGEKNQSPLSKFGIWAVILLVVFLLGLIPMWLQKRTADQTLETVQKQLRQAQIKDHLMTAVVEARSGEYETARQSTSDFFTELNAEIERGDGGSLTADRREKLKPIFTSRDNMITLLAQRDPASVDRLAELYTIYKQSMAASTATTR
jgi:hypothetical protein